MTPAGPLNWDDLRYVLTLAEQGTLTATAHALGVSQPTVSRRLAAIEAHFRTQLFLRNAGGYVLSEAGERLIDAAGDIARRLERIEEVVRYKAEAKAGTVRLAVTETAARHLLESAIPFVLARYPEIDVEIRSGNALSDLAVREVDLAVRFVPPDGAELSGRRLGAMGYGVFAASAYLERHGCPLDEGALAEHRFIAPTRELQQDPGITFLAARPDIRVSLRANSMPVIAEATARGVGLSILPFPVARGWPEVYCVMRLPRLGSRDVWLVQHRDQRRVARIRVVAGALVEDMKRRLAAAPLDWPPGRGARKRSK